MSAENTTWNSSAMEPHVSSAVAHAEPNNASIITCGDNSMTNVENITLTAQNRSGSEVSAFMYIVIVLLFYAVSIVFLMVTYIRREEEEATLENYYTEFVKREKFSDAASVRDERTCKTTHLIKAFQQKYGVSSPLVMGPNSNKNNDIKISYKETLV